mgnify:CR=1 FL=1
MVVWTVHSVYFDQIATPRSYGAPNQEKVSHGGLLGLGLVRMLLGIATRPSNLRLRDGTGRVLFANWIAETVAFSSNDEQHQQ